MNRRFTMSHHVHEYLKLRRSLGYDLRNIGRLLLRFATFVDRSGWHGPLTTRLILRWTYLPQSVSRVYLRARLSAVRGFARYLAARDSRTEVPESHLMPKRFRHRPHIYSERQLQQLLTAAGRMRAAYKLQPQTYKTLFGLLASTGLRISEALKLTQDQVDLNRGIMRIELTKFKKSRLVPLHPTVTQALRRYAAERNRLWRPHGDMPFFVDRHGLALLYRTVNGVFRGLCDALGWLRGNGEGRPPRIHDLRHSFACRRLLRWYRDGENVHHRIATLSTYLGHSEVAYTYWYLTGTPELLALVGSRFERFASPAGRRRS